MHPLLLRIAQLADSGNISRKFVLREMRICNGDLRFTPFSLALVSLKERRICFNFIRRFLRTTIQEMSLEPIKCIFSVIRHKFARNILKRRCIYLSYLLIRKRKVVVFGPEFLLVEFPRDLDRIIWLYQFSIQ